MLLNPSRISHLERRWNLSFAVFVMVITTLPYLVAGWAAQTNWIFTGFLFGVEDGNSYIAKMLSGTFGAWLFQTPYTSIPQDGVLAFFPYLLLGKLAAAPGLHAQLTALFHLFRLVGILGYVWGSYQFIAFFIESPNLRKYGTALAAFGGGIGWLLVLAGQSGWLGSLPLDIYSPETFGFLSLYGLPHLALARGMLFIALVHALQGIKGDQSKTTDIRAGVIVAVYLWLVGFLQPLTVVLCLALLGFYTMGLGSLAVLKKNPDALVEFSRMAWRVVVAGLIVSPLVGYTGWAFSSDPFLKQWTDQNLILSPHPLHYLAAYGLILPFSLVGVGKSLKRKDLSKMFPVFWLAVLPVLVYAPYNLQRRLAEGVWAAWIVLALMGLESHKADRRNRKLLPKILQQAWVIVSPLLFLTPLFLLATGFFGATHPEKPAFQPAEAIRAYEFLQRNATPGDVVLTAYETGNSLPAWAPIRVVIGHGPESVGLAELDPQVRTWFDPATSDSERQNFLEQQHVRFVFYGQAERLLGNWDPANASFLTPIYDTDGVQIFECNVCLVPIE